MTLALLIIAASIATTIIGFVVIGGLRWACRWVRRSSVDPYASEFGDVVNAPRRSV